MPRTISHYGIDGEIGRGGTPAEHKKHVVLDGGHVPNDYRSFVREALDWFDRYLGRVE